jgi:hypothetical protein
MVEEAREFSGVSFVRALIPFMGRVIQSPTKDLTS